MKIEIDFKMEYRVLRRIQVMKNIFIFVIKLQDDQEEEGKEEEDSSSSSSSGEDSDDESEEVSFRHLSLINIEYDVSVVSNTKLFFLCS